MTLEVTPVAPTEHGGQSLVVKVRGRLRRMRSVLGQPPVIGMWLGLLIGLVEPLQRALFRQDAPLQVVGLALTSISECAVPMVNLMLAFSLGHKLRSLRSVRDLLGSESAGISSRALALATFGRMLLIPLLHGSLLYAILDALPAGRLFRLLLFVEVAPPTASMVVVLAHMTKRPKAAQLVALAMVPQYLIAVLSLTLVVAFALHITQPDAAAVAMIANVTGA